MSSTIHSEIAADIACRKGAPTKSSVVAVGFVPEFNKRLAPIRTTPGNERDELPQEIERTDREIDNLVYDLYGLTGEGDGGGRINSKQGRSGNWPF